MLQGRASAEGCGKGCESKRHRHVMRADAERMVAAGLAEWVYVEHEPGSKPWRRRINAVRKLGRRNWRKTMSRDGYESVAVMQLVEGA